MRWSLTLLGLPGASHTPSILELTLLEVVAAPRHATHEQCGTNQS